MRLARRPSSSGRPSCTAWKPKASVTAWSSRSCSQASRWRPGAVRSQAPNSIIDSSLVMMNLIALPAFADNYIWMLHDGAQAVVVDPGDAAPVRAALDAQGLALAGILVTHHHPDHVGGIDALRPSLRGPVYGPAREKIPGALHRRCTTATRSRCSGLRFAVLDVPGHTAGHIAYLQQALPRRADGAHALLRRHAVLRRLRTPLRGHAGADERFARAAGRAAGRHAGLLHSRIHAVQPALRRGSGARQHGACRIRTALPRLGAKPACRRCPHRSAWKGGSTRSCVATCPRSSPRRSPRAPPATRLWPCSPRCANGRTDSDDLACPAGASAAL